MDNNEIIKKIKEIQQKFNLKDCSLNSYIKKHFVDLYNSLKQKTIFLESFKKEKHKNGKIVVYDISIFERIYCLENNLSDRPKCQKCGLNYVTGFNLQKKEYSKWCCPKCQASDEECKTKTKETNIKKYGVEKFSNVEKTRKTRLERYGSFHPSDFKKKIKATKIERYGDENYVNKEKMKNTCLDRYGSEWFNNTNKAKITKLERYGDENYNNRDKFCETLKSISEEKKNEIKQKRDETNILKYGFSNPNKNKNVREKTRNTVLEKYGVESILQSDIVKNKRNLYLRNYVYERIKASYIVEILTPYDEFIKLEHIDKNNNILFMCKKCRTMYKGNWDNGKPTLCDKCYPKMNGTSNAEKEISEFINNLGFKTICNTKQIINPLELDIYIPEKKLAIEFNGLYWHCLGNKDKMYHLKKTEMCEENNIQLIHIFENEWIFKRDIVKSRLKNLLGIYDKTVYARKCEIREVDQNSAKMFQDENHIQGYVNAKIRLGLFYDNELISIMTFGKCRFNKKYEYELLRFCNKLGYHIPGSASKLLNHFEKHFNPTSLISYADRRWSRGKVYEKLGFRLVKKSLPNHWYFKQNTFDLESRVKYQKHKLKDLLEIYDENMTEFENMTNNNFNIIFDCGNLVYEKTKNCKYP